MKEMVRKVANAAVLVIVLSVGKMALASDLNILTVTDGTRPYAENASGDILSMFNRAVRGQLVTTNADYELQPGLLQKWSWNESDNSYELVLRDHLKFSDGSTATAADLEFTLLRGFFSKLQTFYSIYLGSIVGIEKIKGGTPYHSGLVSGVFITWPRSLKVKLKTPNPSFLYSLTRPFFSLTKQSAWNDDLGSYKGLPIGAGQFAVESEDNEKVVLKATAPLANGISRINLYVRDVPGVVYDLSYQQHSSTPELFATQDPASIYTLFFTNQNELSKDRNFRKALRFGIDRDALLAGDREAKPAYEFLPSSHWRSGRNSEFDLAKAKEYFARVPKQLREKSWKIPAFAFGEISVERVKVLERLKSQSASFGFKFTYYPSSEKFLSLETAKQSPGVFTGRICNNADPLLMFSSFKTDSAYKYDNAQNDAEFDHAFEIAAKAVASADRVKTLRKLADYAIEHEFMIPISEEPQLYFYNPKRIRSLGEQPNVTTLYLENLVLAH